jgi:hypothetical protein
MRKGAHFEWDDTKDRQNQKKHGVSFAVAQLSFLDNNIISSIGAGFWRKGKKLYEEENQIHG